MHYNTAGCHWLRQCFDFCTSRALDLDKSCKLLSTAPISLALDGLSSKSPGIASGTRALIGAAVVFAAEDWVFRFDYVLDGGARHDSIEFLHGRADSGGETAAAASLASFAAEIVDH